MKGNKINEENKIGRFSLLKKFCDVTSLHGFKYLSESNRPIYERIFWLIAIAAVYFSVTFVGKDQIENFLMSPVLISFESRQTSVDTIPFPAITICPDTQVKNDILNLTEAMAKRNTLSETQKKYLHVALALCHIELPTLFNLSLDKEIVEKMINSINGEKSCEDYFFTIFWGRRILPNPCKFMQPTVTFFGACLTFNMVPLDQILIYPTKSWASERTKRQNVSWTPSGGYKKMPENIEKNDRDPPWPADEYSAMGMSNFLLKLQDTHSDRACTGGKGFFGFLHNPAEMPGPLHTTFYSENKRLVVVQMNPILYTIDQRLRGWPASKRGCYFDSERTLYYFKIYTQRNCELECLSNLTFNSCGCVAPYMLENAMVCDCLPSCSELQYEIKTVSVARNWANHFLGYEDNNRTIHTMVQFKFEGRYVQGIKRAIMFEFSDFIANIGGLLSLFLGFSILSLVEVIYFLTLRICTKFSNKKRKKYKNKQPIPWREPFF